MIPRYRYRYRTSRKKSTQTHGKRHRKKREIGTEVGTDKVSTNKPITVSVMDTHTLNLDPDPGFWPNLDPNPGPILDPGLNDQF